MSDIPPEIINDIFSRLPVKSLLRFRCVSKSFKSLIDSSKFIQAHLKAQALKPNSDVQLILKADKKLFSLDFRSSISSTQKPKELDHPLKQGNDPIQVLGSCHGLLFISNNLGDNSLWNPSTKMYHKLGRFCGINPPRTPPQREERYLLFDQICGGFGYDSFGDDYKLVRISQCVFCNGNSVYETMIYSLKEGMWKDGKDCPYWLVKEDFGTFASSALYWLASKETHGSLILVSLNLENERFEQVAYPENLGEPFRLNLGVLGESLCLLAASGHITRMDAKNHVLDCIDVWMMKDNGVELSWVKLFSVEQLDGRQHFSYLRPIAYSMTGKEVLLEMDNRKFLWYSLEKKSLKHAKISGGLDSFESFVSLGTLVSVYGREMKRTVKRGLRKSSWNSEATVKKS